MRFQPPTLVNDLIYFGSDKALYALNAANGQLVWNYSNGFGFGNPIVVNGVLYIVSNEQVYAIQIPSSTIEPNLNPNLFL